MSMGWNLVVMWIYFKMGWWIMVLNATFNNISVISWQSVLLVEEIVVPRLKPPSNWRSNYHDGQGLIHTYINQLNHILETVSDKDLDLHLHNVVLFLCSTIRWFIVLNNISVMIVVWCERYLFILLIINSVDLLTDNMRWMNYRTYQQSQNPRWPSNLSNSLQVFL